MSEIYKFLYRPGLDLQWVGIVIGVWLIVSHIIAFLKYEALKEPLQKFPRNTGVGSVLMVICFIWTFIVWSEMDLGEFWSLERPVQFIIIVGGAAVITYVKEFIAVRAVGFFLLLLAAPLLTSAFLEPPKTRLLLVFLSYVMIVKGMFWVGKPYLMRDQIAWATASKSRWQMLCGAGVIYGVAMLLCAVLFWGKEAA